MKSKPCVLAKSVFGDLVFQKVEDLGVLGVVDEGETEGVEEEEGGGEEGGDAGEEGVELEGVVELDGEAVFVRVEQIFIL